MGKLESWGFVINFPLSIKVFTQSMHILFINTLYAPYIGGGAEITLQSLVEGMRDHGHTVTVLSTGPDEGIKEDEINGIRVIRLGIKNTYWPYKANSPGAWKRAVWHVNDVYNNSMADSVKKIISGLKPDIVNCHNLVGFSCATWGAIHSLGIPISQVLHDLYNICPKSNMFCKGRACHSQCVKCKIFRLPHKRLSKQVSCVIGVSDYILKTHLKHGLFSEATIKTSIHNSRTYSLCEARHKDKGEKIRFGFIGTLLPAKGVELLISTFKKVASNDAELIIAGKGNEF